MATTRSTLGDYFELQRGTTYKSRLLGRPGPGLLGLGSIERNGGFRGDSLKTYGGDSPEKLLVQPGQLYVSLKDVTQSGDLLGAVARLPRHHAPGRLTQDTVKLEPKVADVPIDYIYWLLRTPAYRNYCRAHATGTTNLGLPRRDFLDFPVPEPTSFQRTIVDILGALDDKIELNRRMNRTLEEMAQAIFKSWFIDFDGHDDLVESELGLIPRGWEVGRLGDVAEERREAVDPTGLDPETPYIGLADMPQGSIALGEWGRAADATSGKVRFDSGDILFGKLRPYFKKVGIAPRAGICSSDILVVRGREGGQHAHVLGVLTYDPFIDFTSAASTGTRMPRVSWKTMATYPLVLPPGEDFLAFDRIASPSFARIRANIDESRTLAALRDTLLPKLISGEVRVPEAEEIMERAL